MNDQVTTNQFPLPDDDDGMARLARRANEAHDKATGAIEQALLHALEAGQALLEAKRLCRRHKWTAWLKANFRASTRTAQGYMRLAVHWPQVGGDPQRAAGLSQRQIEKLIKGFSCSDGRVNPRRLAVAQRLEAEVEARDGTGEPPAASEPALPAPVVVSGDPFGVVVERLEQALAELRRLRGEPEHGRYARHLMRALKRLRAAVAKRRWFWGGHKH